MCERIKTIRKAECQSMLKPIITRHQDLHKEFNSISHLLDTRSKRAWVAGVGTVMKHIFGTLSEDDGIKYDEAIRALQNNEKKLASLIKDNILVTNSVISSFNKSISNIKINEDNLNNAINNLSLLFQDLFNNTRDQEYQSHLSVIIDSLETTLLALSFQLEDITNAVLFSSQNILHPAVVTPQQLHKELVDSIKYLPSNLEFPITLDISSIHSLLNVSHIVSYYVNHKIIFVVRVPLVAVREFSLFHVLSLPISHNVNQSSFYSMIIPSHKYIAMTKDKMQYCNIDELNVCTAVNPGNYICEVSSVYALDAKASCESEMLTKVVKTLPSQCETKTLFGHLDLWKQINYNKWIYVQSDPTRITIDCKNSNVHENTVHGTGILYIPQGCTGYCRSTTFISKPYYNNVTIQVNRLDFDLIKDNCCNLAAVQKLDNVSPVSLQNIDLDNLHLYRTSLLNQLKTANGLANSPHIIKYGTHYSILIIVMFVLLLCWIIFKMFKYLRPSGNLPINIPFIDSLSSNKNDQNQQTDDQETNREHSSAVTENIPLPKLRTNI